MSDKKSKPIHPMAAVFPLVKPVGVDLEKQSKPSPFRGVDKEPIKYLHKSGKGENAETYRKDKHGELDVTKAKESHMVVPPELRGMVSEEEYAEMMDMTVMSCLKIHENIQKQIDAPKGAMEQFGDEKVAKMLPYLPEVSKFKLLANMIVSDMKELGRELKTIKSLYTRFLKEDGTPLDDIDHTDAYMLETIADIKLRYMVCANRVKSSLFSHVKHASDFYTAMNIRYYSDHPDEAPEDTRKFMEERLGIFLKPAAVGVPT